VCGCGDRTLDGTEAIGYFSAGRTQRLQLPTLSIFSVNQFVCLQGIGELHFFGVPFFPAGGEKLFSYITKAP
jgi:hypothetical protein